MAGSRTSDRRRPLRPVRSTAEVAQNAVEIVAGSQFERGPERRTLPAAEFAVGHGQYKRQHGGNDVGG